MAPTYKDVNRFGTKNRDSVSSHGAVNTSVTNVRNAEIYLQNGGPEAQKSIASKKSHGAKKRKTGRNSGRAKIESKDSVAGGGDSIENDKEHSQLQTIESTYGVNEQV